MQASKLLLTSLFSIATLSYCSTALAAPSDVGSVLMQFQTASTKFGVQILIAAKWLSITLATIDLSLMVVTKLIQGEGPHEIGIAIVLRVMWYGFLIFLMNVGNMTALIDGFRILGENASGISVVSPTDVFLQGVDVVNIFMTKFADSANVGGVPVPAGFAAAANPLVALMVGLVLILIVLSFLVMTAQYGVIVVQMYFFLACYPLIVSFGALKHGRDMTTKTISGAIVIGVKFLAIYFVLFAAQQMAAGMAEVLKDFSIADLTPMWTCLGMAGLLAFLALKVPQMAADLLNGTVSLSGGDVMAAGAIGGGAAAAIAGSAASIAGGAGNSLGGALRAGSAAIDHARASGATGIGGLAAGAASALGTAGFEKASDAIKGLGTPSTGHSSIAERIGSKTASISEVNASRNPAATMSDSQPAAPISTGFTVDGPAAPAPTIRQQHRTEEINSPNPDNKHAPLAANPTSSNNVQSGGQSLSARPERLAVQPEAPGGGTKLASNLANELKRADSASHAALNIQTPYHD